MKFIKSNSVAMLAWKQSNLKTWCNKSYVLELVSPSSVYKKCYMVI